MKKANTVKVSSKVTSKVCVAVCVRAVPSTLNRTGTKISIGDIFSYVKEVYRNGENHLIGVAGNSVPSVFFDTLK